MFGWDVVFPFIPWGQEGHVMFLFEFTYHKGGLFVRDFFVCLAEFVHHATVFIPALVGLHFCKRSVTISSGKIFPDQFETYLYSLSSLQYTFHEIIFTQWYYVKI